MDYISGSLVVIAVVDLLKSLKAKDYEAVLKVIVAAAIGYGAGFLGLAGLTTGTGLVAGLNAVGIYKVGTKLGGN